MKVYLLNKQFSAYIIAALLFTLSGCASQQNNSQPLISDQAKAQAEQQAETIFAEYYQYLLTASPNLRLSLGLRDELGLLPKQWDDISAHAEKKRQLKLQEFEQKLAVINSQALTPAQLINSKILADELKTQKAFFRFSDYDYPLSQMGGWHTATSQILINQQKIDSLSDAHQYIDRVYAVKPLFKALNQRLLDSERAGALPAKFVLESVINTCENLTHGFPFSSPKKNKSAKKDGQKSLLNEHVIWQDFNSKISKLDIYPESRKVLQFKLRKALKRSWLPSYTKLISTLKRQLKKAPDFISSQQLPAGQEYYQLLLNYHTGSELDAEQIHQLGLQEVSRIQQQIRQLAPHLGYQATENSEIKALLTWLEDNNSQFDDKSDQAFIDYQKNILETINDKLPEFFAELPNIPMVIKAVEPYRQASSPIAFYQSPAQDGSRPGIYYINTARKDDLAKYRLAALAFHEAIPGHHLQISSALQSKTLVDFRKLSHHTAYSEGWALYAEKLAIEMGGYPTKEDLYGQLVLELWRAVRLVLDTGLHAKGWSFQQALDYRLANTPFSEQDSRMAIQRYLVMPGQATSYKIGQMAFEQLRADSQQRLGDDFDLAQFHSFILQQGAMPLSLLRQVVERSFH